MPVKSRPKYWLNALRSTSSFLSAFCIGYEVELLDILPDGTVDLADLKQRLRPDAVLVAVTAVDSELIRFLQTRK